MNLSHYKVAAKSFLHLHFTTTGSLCGKLWAWDIMKVRVQLWGKLQNMFQAQTIQFCNEDVETCSHSHMGEICSSESWVCLRNVDKSSVPSLWNQLLSPELQVLLPHASGACD